jgi:hypothetical protein
LVVFSSPWCSPPCDGDPQIARWAKRRGISVVIVSYRDSAAGRRVLARHYRDAAHFVVRDPKRALATSMGVGTVPGYVFLDRAGRAAIRQFGRDDALLTRRLSRWLAREG